MGLFGKSNEETHIEAIQREVITVNSLVNNLMSAVERGEFYCKSHRSEIGTTLNSVSSHFNIIKSHAGYIPEQKLARIQVAWGDGISTNNFMMWGMLIETGMNEITEQLTRWGI